MKCTPNPSLDWLSPLIRSTHGTNATTAHSVEPDVWPQWRESLRSPAFIRDTRLTLNTEGCDEWREALLWFPSPLKRPPSSAFRSPMPVCSRPQLSSPVWSVWRHVALPEAVRDACSHLQLKAKRSLTDFGSEHSRGGAGIRLCLRGKEETPEYFGWGYDFTSTLKPLNWISPDWFPSGIWIGSFLLLLILLQWMGYSKHVQTSLCNPSSGFYI